MEAQKALYLPTTSKVKELINSEIIGKIKYLELRLGFQVALLTITGCMIYH